MTMTSTPPGRSFLIIRRSKRYPMIPDATSVNMKDGQKGIFNTRCNATMMNMGTITSSPWPKLMV